MKIKTEKSKIVSRNYKLQVTSYGLRNNYESRSMNYGLRKGFTLIELLIVVAIIAILASAIFLALNPLKRFQDSRDADRARDVTTILEAVKLDQIDNGGSYHDDVSNLSAGSVYMIVDGSSMTAGCDDNNTYCDTNVTNDTSCANLTFLKTESYFKELPISPAGNVTWDDGNSSGEKGTGYTISRSTDNVITVRACESENTTEISTSG
jgi:prepilin-type N-terminal cleavage/methylation domain-containing protein